MAVASYRQLIFLLVICYIIGQVEGNAKRRRRQVSDGINRNVGVSQKNPNEWIVPNNPNNAVGNNQQQPNNNLLASSEGQTSPVRSGGYYNSPEFRAPSFNGEKPVSWFDTKYVNWVSNRETNLDTNRIGDAKNGPPSSLQGAVQPRKEDDARYFLQKVAKTYASKGEKTYNSGPLENQRGRGSVCVNQQNYDGFTFGKFLCPLPPNTGMNQLDQFCCGSGNYQYCCNAQEFSQNQAGGFSDNNYNNQQDYSKHRHHSRSTSRFLAIVLTIVAILAVAGAGIIAFLFYKRYRKGQSKTGKSSVTTRLQDNYSAVPQDPPADRPIITQHEETTTNVQA